MTASRAARRPGRRALTRLPPRRAGGGWAGLRAAAITGRYHDLAAALFLLVLSIVGGWGLVAAGTMTGADAVTFFTPMFSHLGERLGSGDLPGWNPYHLAGAPFAADPQSGWMYLPVMLLFSLFPLGVAADAYILVHLLLATLTAYALARVLGLSVLGALVAAVSYGFSGHLYEGIPGRQVHTVVIAWLPLVLLGAELAIRSSGWVMRALWWGVGGLAVSQVLAGWLGHGALYVMVALGGYVAYRTLIAPPPGIRGVRARLAACALHGTGLLVFGFGLAAGGLLPRVEYNLLSNLAGGYGEESAGVVGGWGLAQWVQVLQYGVPLGGRFSYYAGGATLALALAAPVVARARYSTPYFLALALAALILTGQEPTLLHDALYALVPRFSQIHPHVPERVMTVFYLGPAILAGATVTALPLRGRNTVAACGLAILGLLALGASTLSIAIPTVLAALLALAWLGGRIALREQRWVGALLAVVVAVDLIPAAHAAIERREMMDEFRFRRVDLEAHFEPGGGGEYLRAQRGREPFRFFGYDPRVGGRGQLYNPRRLDAGLPPLVVNNRAIVLELEDLQGYNPVHLARYDELVAAINGRRQLNYHESNVYAGGVSSRLLDMLNVRYVVAPAGAADRAPELRPLASTRVYRDGQIEVLRRPDALPRAWIVHSARRIRPGAALPLLSSGVVDPRETALLEEAPPALAPVAEPAADRVSILSREPDRIRLATETAAPGLLVLSEIYYPAWTASVDGRPERVSVANHALRAVPVPAGRHVVELRYESWTLRLGVLVSLGFGLLLLALAGTAALRSGAGATHPRARGGVAPRSAAAPVTAASEGTAAAPTPPASRGSDDGHRIGSR